MLQTLNDAIRKKMLVIAVQINTEDTMITNIEVIRKMNKNAGLVSTIKIRKLQLMPKTYNKK